MAKTDTDEDVEIVLGYYGRPGTMTAVGRHWPLIATLPDDIATLVPVVQGLAIHEFMAAAYGWTLPGPRKVESHIRRVEDMLDHILALDDRPLSESRPPEKRLVGVCQHFASLLVALLRAKGLPARARYGFGSYFNPGYFEEHIVCEYWNADEGRWVLVDPQFDEVWRSRLKIDHDILDVPRDRFLVAGQAWSRYRDGKADPAKFGTIAGNLRGVWFLAGELLRDLAALNKMELLPWDQWGAMPGPDDSLQEDQMAFYDQVADLSRAPDATFDAVRNRYQGDDRLRVPGAVFNALLQRSEAVSDSTD